MISSICKTFTFDPGITRDEGEWAKTMKQRTIGSVALIALVHVAAGFVFVQAIPALVFSAVILCVVAYALGVFIHRSLLSKEPDLMKMAKASVLSSEEVKTFFKKNPKVDVNISGKEN